MEKGDPPSPALSNTFNQTDDVLHSGFQHLIQHNAAAAADISSHMGSNPNSRYSSPGPQTHMMNTYDHASSYTAPPYPGGYHTGYPIDPSPYPQLPDVNSSATSHNTYSTPGTSPPTPVQADGITTRSGRAIMRPATASTLTRPARIEKPAPRGRAKKRKRAVGDAYAEQSSSISLADPLSELVKGITTIADTDIEAYVNRSPEDRQREVAQSKTGKVKRPMNAFMLYRKAYQNRTKEWKRLDDIRRKEEESNLASEGGRPEKGHDNHQVISQVCGISWNMEPQDLRDQYDEWAKIERNNHKLAFPDYKFAPAKSKVKKAAGGGGDGDGRGGGGGGGGGGRHGDRDSDEDNASNLDAYEWGQYSSGPPSRNATRSARFLDSIDDADYALPHGYPGSAYTSPSPGMQVARLPTAYVAQAPIQHHPHHPHHHPHPSSFHFSNPGKQRPADYGSTLGPGQYYQQNTEFTQQMYPQTYGGAGVYSVRQQGSPAFVENVMINKTNSPASSSLHNSPVLDHHHPYGELVYGQLIAHPHPHPHHPHPHTMPPHLQSQHLMRHTAEHQIDPSLMAAHPGGGPGHDTTYDSLGILGLGQAGDFGADSLPTYQLDHHAGGLGGSHIGSPHPQQFEQAYHAPNETHDTTPGAEGGGGGGGGAGGTGTGAGGGNSDPTMTAAEAKMGSSEWETTLDGSTDYQLEDIDRLLGTTTGSPGG
ncbi:hypothetical protein F5Y12DRAFT_794273 [Xylaria sp. FL1777]|nr:hypothetical protein F5Y12DRAFT_794273 [Xylaria sp. FL1777]